MFLYDEESCKEIYKAEWKRNFLCLLYCSCTVSDRIDDAVKFLHRLWTGGDQSETLQWACCLGDQSLWQCLSELIRDFPPPQGRGSPDEAECVRRKRQRSIVCLSMFAENISCRRILLPAVCRSNSPCPILRISAFYSFMDRAVYTFIYKLKSGFWYGICEKNQKKSTDLPYFSYIS